MKLVWIALIFHLLWVATMVITKNNAGIGFTPPLFGVAPFQLRHDFDGALIAILAGLSLRRMMLGQRPVLMLLLLAFCAAVVAGLPSRAGFISLFLSLSVVAILTFSVIPRISNKRALFVTAVPGVALAGLWTLVSTTPGLRLIATINPSLATNAAQINALGTRNAREQAWALVIDWTNQSATRSIFGGGFGNDFLTQSGAVQIIEGTDYTGVRSPHDYFIGVFARLGWVGVVLIALIVLRLIGVIVRSRRLIAREPILALAALIIVTILPVASFGVVLEAPFGAIPFFWAAGVLLTLRGERRALTFEMHAREAHHR
ncbi:O-antigen ligase family protein [Curtobacterium sp. ZW137]|uniref:O-antigen ligase family protein n=1 Tax=Curtobacterium sp. ZW137 TaxID=2485104 RepID=UPI000F4AFEFE|nr:O-antigen ligase family protein [Curtobacterium sp. ZW137]